MLILNDALREQVIAHARACFPDEACGVLAGAPGSDTPARFIPVDNAAPGATREYAYQFDVTQYLAAFRSMDERGEDPLALMHSHTFTEARPSTLDLLHAGEPDPYYLIVSLKNPARPVLRAWRIRDGAAAEEDIAPVGVDQPQFDEVGHE